MSSPQTNRDIGARLRGFRKAAGDSIAELSATLGIHANTLKNYEAGLTEVGAQTLCAVAQLGWDVNYILYGKSLDLVAGETIDWPAVARIIAETDRLIALNNGQAVTPGMREAIVRLAYKKHCEEKSKQLPEPVYVEPRLAKAG